MKVLFITRGYPTETYKVYGVFEFDQAKSLVRAGHEVIYAAIDLRSFRKKRKWGFVSFVQDGVQVEALHLPCGPLPDFWLNRIRAWSLKKLYQRIEKKYSEPDVIHAHFLQFGLASVQVFAKRAIPLVQTEHLSTLVKEKLPPALVQMGKQTYPQLDRLITVGKFLSANIEKQFAVSSTVIANMVDTHIFHYEPNGSQSTPTRFTFITTASLIERKAIDLLIHAFYVGFAEQPDVELHIFGAGPERRKLTELIQKYQLEQRVFLRGMVHRTEIANQMKKSHCFVLPSRNETFGVAYIEALAAGLPVIATICGGPENFVTKDNGILIQVDDQPGLVQAMKTMHQHGTTFDRKQISTLTKQQFSPENIAQHISDVYQEVIRNQRKEV